MRVVKGKSLISIILILLLVVNIVVLLNLGSSELDGSEELKPEVRKDERGDGPGPAPVIIEDVSGPIPDDDKEK